MDEIKEIAKEIAKSLERITWDIDYHRKELDSKKAQKVALEAEFESLKAKLGISITETTEYKAAF